ncbi:unnamed protein product [Cylindrotheca closterium]|uniref:Uncharacterized protein n=1 Tax=Cylindrotheca closterium TaxID=2856 RepID=A0AAD2FP37_9STRA|nr:unnamed protein product [Cylindrotheca closterium]
MKQATDHLDTLIQDIRSQNPKTLAYWRVTNEPIYKVLQHFASTDSDDDDSSQSVDSLLPQVQTFFDALNAQLSVQESEDPDYQAYLKSKSPETTTPKTTSSTTDVSIVFGGKYPAEGKPRSISERLVNKLSDGKDETAVITVSRSNVSHDMPINCRHVALQNLDHADTSLGSAEFGQILEMAGNEAKKGGDKPGLTLYLTLGQHKGVNPFRRNLQGANNFCLALEKFMTTEKDGNTRNDACDWRVVLTGTDATLPSDYPASHVELLNQSLQIPSYKISEYNFTYATSKLGQYFLLIKTVAQLTGRMDIVEEVEHIVVKIQASVDKAGDNGNYHPPEDGQETPSTFISMAELDQYSRRSMELELELREHLQFAKGISICYTPLHAVPWTQQAVASAAGSEDSLSPKAFVLEQVVKRLKNAISIDQAVECHFK